MAPFPAPLHRAEVALHFKRSASLSVEPLGPHILRSPQPVSAYFDARQLGGRQSLESDVGLTGETGYVSRVEIRELLGKLIAAAECLTDRLEARDAELAKMWAIMSEEVVELKEENAEMRKDVRTLQSLAFQHEEDFYEFLALPPWNNTAVACARRRRSPVGDVHAQYEVMGI